jgi:hypothetical protein
MKSSYRTDGPLVSGGRSKEQHHWVFGRSVGHNRCLPHSSDCCTVRLLGAVLGKVREFSSDEEKENVFRIQAVMEHLVEA